MQISDPIFIFEQKQRKPFAPSLNREGEGGPVRPAIRVTPLTCLDPQLGGRLVETKPPRAPPSSCENPTGDPRRKRICGVCSAMGPDQSRNLR